MESDESCFFASSLSPVAPFQIFNFAVREPLKITSCFEKMLAPMEEVGPNASIASGYAQHVGVTVVRITGSGYSLLGAWKEHSLLCTQDFSHCRDSPQDKHPDKYNPAQQVRDISCWQKDVVDLAKSQL